MPATEPLRLVFLADPRSVHARRWLAWFAGHGHAVTLLDGFGLADAPGAELPDGVRVERYTASGRHGAPLLGGANRRELQAILRRSRAQVLHAHYVRRFGWQAALAGFHPYVVSPWGSDLLKTRGANLRTRWWNRRALRGADLVTVTTEHLRRAAVAAGARPDGIEIVQHGVDTTRFSPGPADAALSERLGLAGRRVVLSARAIRPLYRQEVVVDAFAALPDDAVLLMTAAGADPGYLAAVHERIAARGLGERVRIVDAIPHERMPDHLRLADVVISVPESDSFPVTLLEAMACARPVVASDLPAAREVLAPLAPEALVPVGDVAALASVLRQALDRPDAEAVRRGEALRAWVVANADEDANMARMEALYRRMAQG